MRHVRHACIALVGAVALLLLVGCGTTTTPSASNESASPTGTTSKVCQRLTTINQSLTQLANVGEKTTIGEVKAAQQKLTNALNAVPALPGNAGDALSKLQSANDQLAAAIKDIPDSATVGEVGPRLQDFKGKVTQAQESATKLTSTLKCTS